MDETLLPHEDPADGAERLARAKAEAVVERARARGEAIDEALVVAADTLVVLDGAPLGKPRDRADAARMLRALAGRRHAVVTGLALAHRGALASACDETGVLFAPLSDAEIARYVASGEPDDKAGAYGLQGVGGLLVERIDGSPSSVVGLPVRLLRTLALSLGVDLLG